MRAYYHDKDVLLIHGDAREVLSKLPPADLVVTDPPYSISYKGSAQRGRLGKGTRNLDFFAGDDNWGGMTAMVRAVIQQAIGLLPVNGSIYIFGGHRQISFVASDLEAANFYTRFLVWEKKCPPPSPPRSGYKSGAELILYGYRPLRVWNYVNGPSNVIVADSYRHGQPGKVEHPTQKPFTVIDPLILASSLFGGVVLDPFAGSGTTLLSAKKHGRRAIGIEIEERYCEIAAKRLEGA